jgi:hypothetical protein
MVATSSVIVDLSADTTRELGGSRHPRRFWRVDAHPPVPRESDGRAIDTAAPIWSAVIVTPELHVHPSQDGARWLVDVPDGRPALSSHDTAREAEVTARRLAVAIGARLIYLHDAYHRVRSAPVRPM